MSVPNETPAPTPEQAAPELTLAHDFLGPRHDAHARRTTWVLLLCAATMAIELVGGMVFGSMALIADGLHMATHAGVMFIAAASYRFARRRLGDPSFSFGTGKVPDLAAFASAVSLASTAIFIAVESAGRLLAPTPIAFDQAIAVAAVGLTVNLLSIWLLHDDHAHDHGHHHHGHDHHHEAHDHDHNMRAAYIHVIADTAVGALAIVGLVLGRQFGWLWLDPLMGLAGAYVIARWAVTLIRATGAVLLDRVPEGGLERAVRAALAPSGGRIVDLHLWRLGPGHHAVVASLAGVTPADAAAARARLHALASISHVTVEHLTDRA